MKGFYKFLLSAAFSLVAFTAFSQGTVTGKVVDADLGEPLPGANVLVKGTTNGTSTDFDGNFTVNVSGNSGTLVVSYIGFLRKEVPFTLSGGSVNLGNIILDSDAQELEGVVVVGTGIIDLARDRQTPIAVSSIPAQEIQQKVGTQDITMTLANTPSVYVSGQTGGFGDSRITVRGFGQDNTAFLLNGQPINGMEDGLMYWSNWSGMSDIANGIQVQRGLGSSKLAISSVGGTVNFVTKATEMREGGFGQVALANDNYLKTTMAYNTGISEKGWGFSALLTHWQGDGYMDGTYGEGQIYFFSVGYRPNEKHNFNFLITGAPQEHDQAYRERISTYLENGRRYNDNWGYLNGKYKTEIGNYYHKPVANLNWDFNISETEQLSTVIYASWGRGGSIGSRGNFIPLGPNGQKDFDAAVAQNSAIADGVGTFGTASILRNSVNNHSWYGIVSNFNKKINENLDWNIGVDLRTYKGTHYRQVNDFLGLDAWTENRDILDASGAETGESIPVIADERGKAKAWWATFNTVGEEDRIAWDYSENISYGGLFTQLEYAKDMLSAFFQGSVSNQWHKRTDRYQYLGADQDSEKIDNFGFNVKGGASYKIGDQHSIYANAGYYSRQPYHDNIYLNFTNTVNPLTENEKILGLEAGYGFRSSIFSANLNLYRTSWEDRVTTESNIDEDTGLQTFFTNQAVKQLHTGVEVDFKVRPVDILDIKGFASFGNWEYQGDIIRTTRNDDLQVIDEERTDVDGGKVGDAAQTTFGLGAVVRPLERLSFDADYRHYSNLYADVTTKENLELPSYGVLDVGMSYKMLVGENKDKSIDFRFNVNNALNEIYLLESSTAILAEAGDETYEGVNVNNQVYFGWGRTWNFSLRYNF
ncbi:TonB-dependent receptor [Abyssalbus ytuae]|uniref:TonB-dependent receptor n=1 Tax=Abyssalbus ytuae TaxID=2926907 RepID=A0A9E7D3B8_9FLAO|nr:TonB-dependent receptor [Abyssalbus ytuae]UOB19133.1 TonB-dependent receptor [Abyssalbus ytuae]